MPMENRKTRMIEQLQALQPVKLEIKDDSDRHAGHAAMKGLPAGETHYKVVIASAAFEGKSRIERHRMVQGLLADEFKKGMHALQIKADLPEVEQA